MPYLFNKYYAPRNIVFFLGEGVLIFLSMMFVYWIFRGTGLFLLDFWLYALQSLVVAAIFQLCLYFFDLYDLKQYQSMPDTATRLTQAFGVGCILLAGVYLLAPPIVISTWIFWTGYIVISLVLLCYRWLYYRVLLRRMFVQGIVILGTGQLANNISLEIEGHQDSVYKVLAFVGDKPPEYNPNNVPVFASLDEVLDTFSAESIERLVVAPDEQRGTTPSRALLMWKMRGIAVVSGVTFYEHITGKVLVEKVHPSWIIYSEGFVLARWKYVLKRIADTFFAAILLVMSLPVMLISAAIIKFESPGEIFYRQERVGQKNSHFKVIKFRSMRQDAEKDGAVWATEDDQRVTRFGKFMRKARIDELPQLWNVLRGDMSLVGPRPERQIFVDELVKEIPYYDIRHVVKPGLTGWAQVCYPYGASKKDALRKLEYDLYYIKNNSVALDLVILFNTVKTVVFGRGAR